MILGLVVAGAILSLLPTVLRDSFTDKWFTKPLALGLDISGGVHLVYGVKAEEAVKSRLQGYLNQIRTELRSKKIAVAQAVVSQDLQLQITLLSDSFSADTKAFIQERFPDLVSNGQQMDGTRPRLVYSFSPKTIDAIQAEAIDQAVETLRNRVDQFGVSEPLIQRAGDRRIILQMPGVSDVASVKKVVGSVARLEFRFLPRGNPTSGVGILTLKNKAGAPVIVEDQLAMTGEAVTNASVEFSQTNNRWEVSVTFSPAGKQQFAQITSENVGRQLAIILDGVVQSDPVIEEPITGGQASISGTFTTDEARQLKVVLKAGALPAPLEVLEERAVGPTLGAESVRKGVFAMALGFGVIALFMAVYYRKAGCIAVGTLFLNSVLMLAVLSLFGATLTLPGLAGLALTIGVAVDSNVIIFERIRDELRLGVNRDLAVHSGFDKAFSAILDANLTTLFAGLILYYFGTGPIKGFAVTLCIGIATTMFCAVWVARLCFDKFELKGAASSMSI
jgi:preprotein translocase subunit SecD